MIRWLLTSLFLGSIIAAHAQELLKCDDAQVSFVSEAPLELIEAGSDECVGILDLDKGQFAFRLKVRSFEGFNSPLQKEHFNENYLESDQFPNATFQGRFLEDVDLEAEGVVIHRVKGDFEIHGVSEEYLLNVTIRVGEDGGISFRSEFSVELSTHKIEVPRIVYQKIAEVIDVRVSGVLR